MEEMSADAVDAGTQGHPDPHFPRNADSPIPKDAVNSRRRPNQRHAREDFQQLLLETRRPRRFRLCLLHGAEIRDPQCAVHGPHDFLSVSSASESVSERWESWPGPVLAVAEWSQPVAFPGNFPDN